MGPGAPHQREGILSDERPFVTAAASDPSVSSPATSTPAARARQRIIAPVRAELRLAGWLSVLSGALWPVQAGAIAFAVAGWTAPDGAGPAGAVRGALVAGAVLIVAGILRAGLDHVAGGRLFRAADQTIARERAALIRREARAPGGQGSAAIASLLVQKLPLLQPWITRYHVAMVRVSVLPLLLLALSFSLSWVVGLVLLLAGPLIPVFMALVGMAAEQASRRQLDEIGTMNAMLMERLSALVDIRLLGAEEQVAADFSGRAETLRQRTMAVLRIAFLSSTVLELFSAIGVALVAVFVGFTLLGEIGFGSWGGPLTLGEGLFLLLIAPEFFQPLRDLAAAWHDRAAGFSVVAELDALDDARGGETRAVLVGKGEGAEPLGGALSVTMSGASVLRAGRRIALPDCSLQAGETLAISGDSGIGKTTALMALAGLLPLDRGCIEVCGVALDEASADAWRARLAFVPQKAHFADCTLGNWLDPKGSGTDPREALALADAAQIVKRLPGGLSATLGERGGGVSGGEARRLMLARAVLSGGDLILADEPTADLDPETAARIIAALERLRKSGRAIIVATHDPDLAGAMMRCIAMPPMTDNGARA